MPVLRAQPLDEAPDPAAVRQVETGRRLVQEQHARLVQDAAHDVERAAHPARQRRDGLRAPVRQAEEIEQLPLALLDHARREIVQQAGEAQVLGDGERAIERGLLEHEADRPAHARRARA